MNCPRCEEPTTGFVITGPTEAHAAGCGCRLTPEQVCDVLEAVASGGVDGERL